MFYTLQEYIVFTKGWEYILAVVFVLTFIVYWQLVISSRRDAEADRDEHAEAIQHDDRDLPRAA